MNVPTDAPRAHGPTFWIGVVIGWAAIAFGVRGVFKDGGAVGFGQWFIGVAIAHDVVVAPIAFATAWLAGRILPRHAVLPVRLGLASTGLLTLVTWPLLWGYGRAASNPTALPLDYRRNYAAALVAIWLAVAGSVAIGWIRRRTTHTSPTTTDGPITT